MVLYILHNSKSFRYSLRKDENMESIKAVYDGANFLPMQPIPVKEQFDLEVA